MRKTLHLNEARALTPAIEGVGAWAEKLRAAAFDAVSEHDVKEIMEGIKKRAKEGDLNAAKMLLGYLTSSAPKVSQQIVVVQAEKIPAPARAALGFSPDPDDDDQAPPQTPAEKQTAMELAACREQAARLLNVAGPMKTAILANQLGLSLAQAERAFNCAWFEKSTKGYRLSSAGTEALAAVENPGVDE